ncbi:unnamed protein product [Rhizopus stolonifer]
MIKFIDLHAWLYDITLDLHQKINFLKKLRHKCTSRESKTEPGQQMGDHILTMRNKDKTTLDLTVHHVRVLLIRLNANLCTYFAPELLFPSLALLPDNIYY